MIRLVLDTCVWIKFLEKDKTFELLEQLNNLIEQDKIELLIPEQVMVEIQRNVPRIIKSKKETIKTASSAESVGRG